MEEKKSDDGLGKLLIGYQVVCLLDVLGQKNKLMKWDGIEPLPGKEGFGLQDEQVVALRETIGTIKQLEINFNLIFDGMNKVGSSQGILELPVELQDKYEAYKEHSLSVRQFSDTFIFYSFLMNMKGILSLIPLHRMIISCSVVMLSSLAGKVALRGGIAVGSGIEMDDKNCYGPALAKAYHLESEMAEFPRILVSDEVLDLLNSPFYSDDAQIDGMSKSLAEDCKGGIFCDIDGHWAIDYLAFLSLKEFKNKKLDRSPYTEVFNKAFRFLANEKERFRKQNNLKLASRYARLHYYFESRKHLWV